MHFSIASQGSFGSYARRKNMNSRYWTMIGITIAAVAASSLALQAQEGDAKLQAFFQHYLEEHFRQQPTDATRLGDHRFDGSLITSRRRRARAGSSLTATRWRACRKRWITPS